MGADSLVADHGKFFLGLPFIEEESCPTCGEWCTLKSVEERNEDRKVFLCPNCGSWQKKNAAAMTLGKLGGLARARSLSSQQRHDIAVLARRAGIEKALRRADRVKTYAENRRQAVEHARERGKHTLQEWLALVRFCGSRCVKCGATNRRITKDHIIPVALGGSDRIDNLQPLCWECNSAKNLRAVDYRPTGWWSVIPSLT